jgi:NADPH-dependent 2,4-dienoyl-CoA reductase/sulfur reductase-like enzyme/peroxiredoxin family protein/TusA-related sulfurtransferase
MANKIIIIGGVAGGMTAATRLRRIDENAEIIIFEKGPYVSYANCGLPYFVGNVIKSESSILLQTPESLKARYNLDVRIKSEVVTISRDRKRVIIKNIDSNSTYEETYDKLIISTGAEPIVPPVEGLDDVKNVFTLRSVNDSQLIKEFIRQNQAKNAVIIGGGFIGLELCENLTKLGLNATVVEMQNQVLAPLDFEMASIIHNHLKNNGVNLILGDGLKAFKNKGKKVVLQSEKELNADIIILGIGVKPESKLAVEAGLEVNQRGAIIVNEYLQTSDKSIFAVGDAIEVKDFINKTKVSIPLAWPANRQGRIVADNIYGKEIKYKGTLGAAITKLYDLTVAVTGSNEKILKKLNIDYKVVHTHSYSHATYFPGPEQIDLKLIFSPDGMKIFGAQGIGIDGVDKRLDVINTAIQANMSVFDLQSLELSYAPQFSSAKDPVNILGYAASNLVDGSYDTIQWNEIAERSIDGIILDVREEAEVILGKIPNSINIPLEQLRDRFHEIPIQKPVYVYCKVGARSYLATRILMQHRYNVKSIDGGYLTYAAVYNADYVDTTVDFTNSSFQGNSINQTINLPINSAKIALKIDACGLQCPGPLLKVYEAIKQLEIGQQIQIAATDPGFFPDMEMWCSKTHNILVNKENQNGIYIATIEKGQNSTIGNSNSNAPMIQHSDNKGMTMIVFDGDLDKAIASFILANGGASYGKNVTMFFTFWGLNILRKPYGVSVKKTLLESMFGAMMPRGISKLGLSKMNMLGMGPIMIKYMMNKKKVDSLETLMQKAIDNGVKLVACTMSMDIMGIKQAELIDQAVLGGVGSYLGEAEGANINLFI